MRCAARRVTRWTSIVAGLFGCVVWPAIAGTASAPHGQIEPYVPREGRPRPLVVVVGDNESTELTDYVVPYAILRQSGVADVMALGAHESFLQMRPALRIAPQASLAEFDSRFPGGADYVVIPAGRNMLPSDPRIVTWLRSQYGKGATLVSICDGAFTLAQTGLLEGRRATAHWATESLRRRLYPATDWVANARYVADGRVISSAGVSASIPVSIALVEAIGGPDRAAALARELGVSEWGTAHDSDRFGASGALRRAGRMESWLRRREDVGLQVTAGIDDVTLALTVDAFGRTPQLNVLALTATTATVVTRHGLTILSDRNLREGRAPDRTIDVRETAPPAAALDAALAAIGAEFGDATAASIAAQLEYPLGLVASK